MDAIIGFFSLLIKWLFRIPPRPLALKDSPLEKLPLELILHITSYLPPESATVFAISCHPLYLLLETQHVGPLKQAEHPARDAFLRLLDRDLPSHLLCPHCNKFHNIKFAENHLPSRQYLNSVAISKPMLECWRDDGVSGIRTSTHFEFSSTIFRMAMKVHRQGRDTTRLTKLLSYDSIHSVRQGYTEQCSATARIQDGSLLMREQRVFMIPFSQKIPIPWDGSIDICVHIKFWTMLGLYMRGIDIPHGDEILRHENKQGIIYCEHCYNEFRVDFKSYKEIGNAMFVTKWIDLGDGSDPSDIKWASRRWCPRMNYTKLARLEAGFRRGSIYAAFEQKVDSEFKFDELLTSRDLMELGKKSPWPTNIKVSCEKHGRYLVVRDGRFEPNPVERRWERRIEIRGVLIFK